MSTSHPSLSRQLSRQLQQRILSGDILPGQALPSQRELVKQLGVSRSSVREAVQDLELMGLIETRHGGRSRCLNLLAGHMELPQVGTSSSIGFQLQVMEMRAALEGEAAYYAAQRASDGQLQQIAAEYRAMQQRGSGSTTLKKAKSDLRFHMLIAESSHHLLVVSFSQLFYTRYFNAIYGVLDRTLKKFGRYPDRIGVQHSVIYQALLDRDADKARAAATEHILYTRDLLKACE